MEVEVGVGGSCTLSRSGLEKCTLFPCAPCHLLWVSLTRAVFLPLQSPSDHGGSLTLGPGDLLMDFTEATPLVNFSFL